MSIKIVVDTNKLLGENSFGTLFGNRYELEKILSIKGTELVVPAIVLDELMHQKEVAFKTAKSRITETSYYKQRVNRELKDMIELDCLNLASLLSDKSIPYTTIDIINKASALDRIRQLATNYQAPFQVYSDSKDNSDKGFKDAYIAQTIDEYISELDDNENIFLLTKDSRFAEYFQDNARVVHVHSFNDINNHIQQPQAGSVAQDKIPSAGTVRPLSKERLEVQELLTNFRNSGSFASTHSLITQLAKADAARKLTETDLVDILVSTAENNQINWLLGDQDVREFILPLFNKYGEQLSSQGYNIIAIGLGLESRKTANMHNAEEYDYIESMAESWYELQSDIARGK